MKENAEAFWIIKLRKILFYQKQNSFYVCETNTNQVRRTSDIVNYTLLIVNWNSYKCASPREV